MKSLQKKYLILSISLIITLTFSAFGQLSSVKIDRLVSDAMDKFNVAGVAVAIVKDGKIIHEKGYGVATKKTKTSVNQHTNFAIASNIKAFTTTALAILVEEGKIKWTDKVINHIPEFKMYNAYVTENFNIQDLRSEERRVGKSVDLDRRGITKKNKHRDESMQ